MSDKEKMKLCPIPVNWQLCRHSLSVSFKFDILHISSIATFNKGIEKEIEISIFPIINFKVSNFNFGDHNYREFLIKYPEGNRYVEDTFDWFQYRQDKYWLENDLCYDPYFYIVENSTWYNEKVFYPKYLDKGYKHFLIVGYDEYVEAIGEKYTVEIKE